VVDSRSTSTRASAQRPKAANFWTYRAYRAYRAHFLRAAKTGAGENQCLVSHRGGSPGLQSGGAGFQTRGNARSQS
jgi:hypothetical protein